MRQIKFRGKNAKDEWVYGSLIINETENDKGKFQVAFIVPDLPCASNGGDFYTTNMERVKPETIGQFTGLKDKNGREIYDGDIVDVAQPNGEHSLCLVEMTEKGYWCVSFSIHEKVILGFVNKMQVDLVGNIHDNPKIIKRK